MYGLSESNGPRPVAACTSTAPRANTSAAGPTERGRWNCSGAMNGGVPINFPVSVRRSLSDGRDIPKSMTLGPPADSRTLLGLRSRCTTPARWMSRSASASPAPACVPRAGERAVPLHLLGERRAGDESVAIQGRSASGSASTTGAVKAPLTRRAAATSCRKRARNSGSAAYSACTTLTASRSPEAERGEMDHAHTAGAEACLEPVLPGVLRMLRFRARSGAAQRRHGPPPCCFGAARRRGA